MTGLASKVAAILSTTVAASSPSATSTSKCLPCRTDVTESKPRLGSARWIACPCGSRISGLSITSTTTLAALPTLSARGCAGVRREAGAGEPFVRLDVLGQGAFDDLRGHPRLGGLLLP